MFSSSSLSKSEAIIKPSVGIGTSTKIFKFVWETINGVFAWITTSPPTLFPLASLTTLIVNSLPAFTVDGNSTIPAQSS